jgi:hypothetical protein
MSWYKIGQDIDGEAAGDQFSPCSVSSDGLTVAIGAKLNDGNGTDSGSVRIYKFINSAWSKIGQDLDGAAAGDNAGNQVSLNSDGTIVAVGAPGNDTNGSNSGSVTVYKFNATTTLWEIFGQVVYGEVSGDAFGFSVSLSKDGQYFVSGSPYYDASNADVGSVRVFKYNNSTLQWELFGQRLTGSLASEWFGYSVAINSDGSRIVVGAPRSITAGAVTDNTRVYGYNAGSNTWTQLGSNIASEGTGDQAGYSVAINDTGTRIAIGSIMQKVSTSARGSARVFSFNGTSWSKLGATIFGESTGDRSGISVSLNGVGDMLAIGEAYDDNSGADAGDVRIFYYDTASRSWLFVSQYINGEAAGDYSGSSVSLSSDGAIVAIGAPNNDGTGTNAGHVRVYKVPNLPFYKWQQLGTDITDPSDSYGGWSIASNNDGSIIAVGSVFTSASNVYRGVLRVYSWINSTWTKLGSDINGLVDNDGFGNSVCLSSDGTIVAAHARMGTTRIYKYNGTSWSNIGSLTAGSGYSFWPDENYRHVAMSADGTKIAVGNQYINSQKGEVRIYKYNSGTSWSSYGATLTPPSASDRFGASVAFNTSGTIMAVGSPRLSSRPGYIYVYSYNSGTNAWVKIGNTIQASAVSDYFGFNVSLDSTGYIVSGTDANLNSYIYNYNNSSNTWIQRGSTNLGTGEATALSQDGTYLLTAKKNAANPVGPVSSAGLIQFIKYDSDVNSYNTLVGFYGTLSGGLLGSSIALNSDNSRIIAGAPASGSSNPGFARVYQAYEYSSITVNSPTSITKTYGSAVFNINLNATLSNNTKPILYDVSGNAGIISVDSSGNVTVLAVGTTGIGLTQSFCLGSARIPVTISKANSVISVSSTSYNKFVIDPSFNLNATSNQSQTPITYSSSNINIVTVDASGQVVLVGNGTATVTVSQASNANYNAGSATVTISVGGAVTTISASSPVSKSFGDNNFTLSFTSNNPETTYYSSSDTTVATIDASGSITLLKPGSTNITISKLLSSNYTAGSTVVVLNVSKTYSALQLKTNGFTISQLQNATYSSTEIISAGYLASELNSANYTATQLKTGGYLATQLKAGGYSITNLYDAGYSATEMKSASYLASELKLVGYTATNLFDASYTASEMKLASFTASELRIAGYSASQLKIASFTATELKTAFYTASNLYDAGYTASEMKTASYTASELKAVGYTGSTLYSAGYTATEMKSASYTATELKALGYTGSNLYTAGYTSTEMNAASFTASELRVIGYTVAQLKTALYSDSNIISAGYQAIDLKNEGYTANQLRNNYNVTELVNAGYTAENIIAAGYTSTELKTAGFTISQLKIYGYTDAQILTAGYTATELRSANYSASQARQYSYTLSQLRTGGYTPTQVLAAGFTRTEIAQSGYSVNELANASFTASDLRIAGFTPQQLTVSYNTSQILAAGFSANTLYLSGYTLTQLRQNNYSDASILSAGFPATVLLSANFKANQLKPYGYTALELRTGGFILSDILSIGYTASELRAANFSGSDLKAVNYTAQQLIEGGYSKNVVISLGYAISDLKSATFTASDLRTNNYTIAQLKTGGYSDSEILAGGYTATVLKTAGYTASQLRDNNYTVQNMKDANFSSSEIILAGFSGLTLRTNGYTAQQLKNNNFSLSDLKTAGYSDSDILAVGFTADELKLNGYTVIDLKNNNYTASSAKLAGYSDTDILVAGFSASQLKLANYTASQLRINGYSISDLKTALYSTQSILTAGYSATNLKAENYTASQLKQYGYTVANLVLGGYTAADILSVNYLASSLLQYYTVFQLKSYNYTPLQIKTGGFNDADILSASFTSSSLKVAGYTASQLRLNSYSISDLVSGGYSKTEILSGGFSSIDLKTAGYLASELRQNNYTIQDLIDAGYSDSNILSAGYSASDLKINGYTVSQLFANNYTASQLREANYTDSDIIGVGYTISQLKTAGFLPNDLKNTYSDSDILTGNFTATSLKDAGYNVSQLKENNYNVAQLKNANYNNNDILSAGFSATELKQNSYSASDLHDNNYSSTELKEAGFNVSELQSAGYTIEEIMFADYLASQLRLAGYTSVQLKNGFYSALELKTGGYVDEDVLSIGYTVKELTIAGYTVEQMRDYGYSDGTILTGISTAIETLPNPPTITDVVSSNSKIFVYFTDSSNTDIPVIGYKYTLNGGTDQLWTINNESPLIILGLTNGTSYNIGIYSVNRNGTSIISNIFNDIVPSDIPNKPFIVNPISADGVISFDYVLDNVNGSNVSEYYYSVDGINFTQTQPVGNKISITGLNGNETYNISFKIKNERGFSEKSNTLTIKNIGTMAVPQITDVSFNNKVASIYYTIDSSLNKIFYKYSLNDSTYLYFKNQNNPLLLSNLENYATYNIKIKAEHFLYGESNASNIVSFTTRSEPSKSIILSANYFNGLITMSVIEGSSNGSPINYYYYSLNGSSYSEIDSIEDSVISIKKIIDTNINNTIKIISENSIGQSEESNSAVLTYTILPDKPTLNSVIAGDEKCTVNFTDGATYNSPILCYKYKLSNDPKVYIAKDISNPLVITGLTNGTEYNIKMKTLCQSGESEYSNISELFKPFGVPKPPTITVIEPRIKSLLVYFEPGSNGGLEVIGYKYSVNDGELINATSITSPITIYDLADKFNFSITLYAYNSQGISGQSNTLVGVPGVPTAPVLNSVTTSDSTFSINYTQSSLNNGALVTRMFYTFDNINLIPFRAISNPLIITGLRNGVFYNLSICSLNSNGVSSLSNTLKNVIISVPPARLVINTVSLFYESATTCYALVNIAPPNDNGSPIIKYKYALGFSTNYIDITGTNLPLVIPNLPVNTSITIKLRAENLYGQSPESLPSKSARYSIGVPSRIAIRSVTTSLNTMTVNFLKPAINGAEIITYKYSLNGGTYVDISSNLVPFNIPIQNNVNYNVQIIATNIIGDSQPSLPLTKPVSFIYLIPLPPKITSIVGSNQTLTVNFSASVSRGAPVTNYSYSIDSSINIVNTQITSSPLVINGLVNDASYSVILYANSDAGLSLGSIPVIGIPKYSVPGTPVISNITPLNQSCSVLFGPPVINGSPITTYLYSIDGGNTLINTNRNESPLLITGLTNDVSYNLQIVAVNALGNSPLSLPRTFTPVYKIPSTPVISRISPGIKSMTIFFQPSLPNGSAIESYYYSTDNGYTLINTNRLTSPITINTGLTSFYTYNVTLYSKNELGYSLASNIVTTTIK